MGRPRKFKQPRNQTVTFETTELQVIREEAERKGVSISAYIRGVSLIGMVALWGKRRADEQSAEARETISRPDGAGPGRPTAKRPRPPGS